MKSCSNSKHVITFRDHILARVYLENDPYASNTCSMNIHTYKQTQTLCVACIIVIIRALWARINA